MDDITWQALTVALTLVGLAATGYFWRSRGPVAGLRALSFTLLPAAAYLTGTLRLIWEIGDAVVSWAVRFAFSPTVWLGIVLAGLAATLFVVTSLLRRRGAGTGRSEAAPHGRRGVPADPARPSLPGASGRPPAASPADDDMADIEAILRKHGIS